MSENAITQDNREKIYTAVAGQSDFAVTFKFQQNEDLEFGIFKGSGSFTVLDLGADYSVSGAEKDAGGTITLQVPATAGTQYRLRGKASLELNKKLAGAKYAPDTTNSLFERCLIWIVEQMRDVKAINVAFDYFYGVTLPYIYGVSDQVADQFQTIVGLEAATKVAKDEAVSAKNLALTAKVNADTANGKAQAAQTASEAASEISVAHAGIATTQASIATSKAGVATTQAGIATTKAGEAAASEAKALTYKAQAESAKNQALAAFANFQDVYLGEFSEAPTLDLDGSVLDGGELYFDDIANAMKVYTGIQWVNAYVTAEGVLLIASNLSDLTDAQAARINLGLGNVDNTPDADKPVSSAVQTALNEKLSTSGKAADAAMLDGLGSDQFLRSDEAGTVSGNLTVEGDLHVGKDGGGDSNLHFYDDNSNTERTIQWDDSVNRFRIEEEAGWTNLTQVRCWVRFDGTGTLKIKSSFNVASVSDKGTGYYRVNIDKDMDNGNYAVAVGGARATNLPGFINSMNHKSGYFELQGYSGSTSAKTDWNIVSAVVLTT